MKVVQLTVLAMALYFPSMGNANPITRAELTLDEFTEHSLIFTARWDSDKYGEFASLYLPVEYLGAVHNPRIVFEEYWWGGIFELNFDILHPEGGSHFIGITYPIDNIDFDQDGWWKTIDRTAADATVGFDGTQVRKVPGDPYALQFVYSAPETGNTFLLLSGTVAVMLFSHRRKLP